jgi:hypothetical protein
VGSGVGFVWVGIWTQLQRTTCRTLPDAQCLLHNAYGAERLVAHCPLHIACRALPAARKTPPTKARVSHTACRALHAMHRPLRTTCCDGLLCTACCKQTPPNSSHCLPPTACCKQTPHNTPQRALPAASKHPTTAGVCGATHRFRSGCCLTCLHKTCCSAQHCLQVEQERSTQGRQQVDSQCW